MTAAAVSSVCESLAGADHELATLAKATGPTAPTPSPRPGRRRTCSTSATVLTTVAALREETRGGHLEARTSPSATTSTGSATSTPSARPDGTVETSFHPLTAPAGSEPA